MQKQHSEILNNNQPVVVVGTGPVGMAAALEASQKGYPVVLVGNRIVGVRSQRVKITAKDAKLFQKYCQANDKEDEKFIQKLKENGNTVSVGAIERFWQRKINAAIENNPEQFRVIDQKIGHLTAVNTQGNPLSITIQNQNGEEEKIPFKHLIDASGTSRSAFMLEANVDMKNSNRKEYEIERSKVEEQLPYQPPHAEQGTAIFKLKNKKLAKKLAAEPKKIPKKLKGKIRNKITPRTIYVPKFSEEETAALKAAGWHESNKPEIYIIANANCTKFYVGGDIPSDIYNLPPELRKEKVEAWSRFVLEKQFGISGEEFTIPVKSSADYQNKKQRYNLSDGETQEVADKKNGLRLTAFKMKLSRLKQPVKDLYADQPGQHVMMAMGDANQDPNFHKAHGMADGLKAVRVMADCLPSEKEHRAFNIKKFNTFSIDLRNKHDKRMKSVQRKKTKRIFSITHSSIQIKSTFVSSSKKVLNFLKVDRKKFLKNKLNAEEAKISVSPHDAVAAKNSPQLPLREANIMPDEQSSSKKSYSPK